MGLVDDDRIALPGLIKRLPVEHGPEGLQGGHDDPGALFQRLTQLGRLGLIITLSDALHHPVLAFDPGDGLLQLSVKVSTVGDDHHPVEDRLVRVVMQHGELVSRPGDGVSLSGASRVLVEVVAWSLAAFGNETAHTLPLVIAGEDQPALAPGIAPGFTLQHQIVLQKVQPGILLPDIVPQVVGAVVALGYRVALAALVPLVEGEEEGFCPLPNE